MLKHESPIIHEDIENILKALGKDIRLLEGKTMLITGAGGFIGSYFCDVINRANESFLKEPCRLLAFDNFITGKETNISHLESSEHVEIINHDVIQPIEVKGDVHYIIHAASIASPMIYRKYPLKTMDVNVIGTRNMLELAKEKKITSMLFMGTSEVYGDPLPGNIPTEEDYRGNVAFLGPRACYDESKRFAETMCYTFHQEYGVPVKTTRSFNIYGPRLKLDDKRVVPDFVADALNGKDLVLYSDGTPTRSFCYISDGVVGHLKVLLSGFDGEAFNVGNSDEEISMKQLAETTIDVVNPALKLVFKGSKDKEYLTDNPQRRIPDLKKIHDQLSYQPKVNLREGISRYVEWAKGTLEKK